MESLSTLGKFLVLQELGHGGMGAVYIGYEPSMRRLVVIKTLFEQFAKEENWIKRFLREADVYRKLDHPNIVKFYDAGVENGTNYIAMEYIKSRPLDEVLKKQGKMPVDVAVRLMGYLADAVSLAHEKGIIHRDLKPQNIMFSEDGVVKLIDFGIAYAEDDLIKTSEGTILGTFQYAAPEQNQGKKVDERSDLYALGAIFYEMLCGKRATAGASLLEVIKAQITGGIIAPSVHNPEVPKGLEKLILKLLEKDPNNRYKTAKELIFDIQKYKEDPKNFDPAGKMFDDEVTAKQFEKGKEALIKGQYDLALDMLKSVAQAKPDSAEVQIALGKTYAQKNFKKPCLDAFKKALQLEPEKVEYMLDYANSLYKLRAYDEAEVEIQKALDLEPDNMYVVNASKKIKEAKANPPAQEPSAAASRPTGKSPVIAQTPQSKSGIYDRRPTQTTPQLASAPPAAEAATEGATRPPSILDRLIWFLPWLRRGAKLKAMLLMAMQVVVISSLVYALAAWPKFEIDWGRSAKNQSNPIISATLSGWHLKRYDLNLQAFLNGPGRWVTVLLAVGLVLLMGVKAPRQPEEPPAS